MSDPAASSHVRHLVILGGGVAAWMAAATLAKAFAGTGRTISVVEPDQADEGIGPCGGAEASLPGLVDHLDWLGIDERQVLQMADASFSLGTAFTGWAAAGRSHFLPFGDVGARLGPLAFHQLALRLRADGAPLRLGDHSLAALAAGMERFAHPSRDPRSPLSAYAYGLHLSLDGLRTLLRRSAEGAGVQGGHPPFRGVRTLPGGGIDAVRLADGSDLAGDFFIDCSGPGGLLIGGALGSRFESWRAWLPCDRLLSGSMPGGGRPPPPYAHHQASRSGWRRSVPLSTGGHESFLYSSAHIDEGQARAEGGATAAAPLCSFEPGLRREAWTHNCLAIGSAALTLDPLARTSLHLVQTALQRFLRLFPAAPGGPEAREYNRLLAEEAERLRDFLILPFKLNGRAGEPLWDACRSMEVPDSLAHKVALFEARGVVPMHDGETFESQDWVMMLDELGVRPRRYDRFADSIPIEQAQRHVSRLRTILLQAAGTLPAHGDYLRHLGAPEARQAS